MRELCQKNQIKSQQQSKLYLQDQQEEISDNEDIKNPRQQKDRDYSYRRKDRDSQPLTNRSRYQRDDGIDSYYTHDQYSRTPPPRFNHRDDYNIMQNSDDELSVYEVSLR